MLLAAALTDIPHFNLTGFFRILLPTKATDFIFPIWSRLKRKQLKTKTLNRIMHDVLHHEDLFTI